MNKLEPRKNLFILPFDHYSAFTDLFNDESDSLSENVKKQVAELKMIVYRGFLKSWEFGLPKEQSAIIVDELFGSEVLQAAARDDVAVCLGIEKHNTAEFDFFYGDDWAHNIKRFQPAIVKALLKYNPADSLELKQRQAARLKQLSDWCDQEAYSFMLEPLIPPSSEQLKAVGGDKEKYDQEIRPGLAKIMLTELYEFKIKPDIWKLEGCLRVNDCLSLFDKVRELGGSQANIIMLGRNQPLALVENQLKAAALGGWFGFAVGRTVWYEPLRQYVKDGHLTKAIDDIANNFYHLYQVFKGK